MCTRHLLTISVVFIIALFGFTTQAIAAWWAYKTCGVISPKSTPQSQLRDILNIFHVFVGAGESLFDSA
jgi:hypothetical protein